MINLLKEFKVKKEEIELDRKAIIDAIGYPKNEVPQEISILVDKLITESFNYINLYCGYLLIEDKSVELKGNSIKLNEIEFRVGKVISNSLNKIEEAAIIIATIGSEFDQWSKKIFHNDPLAGFIIDLIGSELAEKIAGWIENEINTCVNKNNKFISNRYSPGYCGWNVAEQKKIFSFFPKEFCGVTLTDSALMIPRKSISGIIGIGRELNKIDYPCEDCNLPHCYKNRPNL